MKDGKTAVYLAGSGVMLAYALPRLEFAQAWTGATVFAAVWTGFALLVIAALLYRLLRVDEDRDRQLARIRLHKWQMWERKMTGHQQEPATGDGRSDRRVAPRTPAGRSR